MGYDPFSPIASAFINVLCVPAGRIKPEVFNGFVTYLQDIASIQGRSHQVSDTTVATNGSTSAAADEPPLLFQFGASVHTGDLLHAFFFEPNQRPAIVLGLVDGSVGSSNFSSTLQEARSQLLQVATLGLASSVQSQLLVFNATVQSSEKGAVFIESLSSQQCPQALTDWLTSTAISCLTHDLEELRTADVELPLSRYKSDRPNGAEARRDSKSEDGRRQSVVNSASRTPTQTPPLPEDPVQRASTGKSISAALIKLEMGLWSEALDQFADGARASRDVNSSAWHAKALEGILVCMLLLAWTSRPFQIPQNCYPTTRGFANSSAVHRIAEDNRGMSEKFANSSASRLQGLTAMLPGFLATIMNLYDRSALGYDNALPQILVCEARVRMGKMLVVVQENGCVLNKAALQQLIGPLPGSIISQDLEPPNIPLILRPSALGNLLIESITEAQIHLPLQSASRVYFAVCQSLSDLKLERKQAFYLKDILQKLPPILVEARKAGSAEVNAHSSNSSTSSSAYADRNHQRVTQGARSLLQLALRTYELPDLYTESETTNSSDVEQAARQRLDSWLHIFLSGDIATKLEVVRLCIRVSDALPDLIGSIQFMSLLLFLARQTVTLSKGLGNPVPLIPTEEQTRLANGINNAVNTSQRLNVTNGLAQYWDDFLVRGVEIYDHASAGKLIPHSSQDLSHTTTSGTAKKDPFIYNPFSEGRAASGPPVLVKDEVRSFEITLQNPLEIDIEIESIALVVEGSAFETKPLHILLEPLCLQKYTMYGTPTEVGSVKITGCLVKIKNCIEQQFGIFSGAWKAPNIVKRKPKSSLNVELPTRMIVELKVVERLPQLQISDSGLVQRSLMLLDGEKSTFSVTLENTGDIPADLVLFSYQDSVSKQIQDALATKDLQPADTYELQQQLASKAIVKRVHTVEDSKQKMGLNAANVEAYSKKVFEFEVLGRPGLTETTVLIDYAYLGKPRNEVEGTFYTRQLRFVANITVNGSVDIFRCNIMSLPPTVNTISENKNTERIPAALNNTAGQDSSNIDPCLLQLDIRNIWQEAVTFTIETTTIDTDESSAAEWEVATAATLQPTQIERALLLIPRLYIADPFAAVPSLDTKRQFVVSASKSTLEAEMASREAFWYRQQLCQTLRVTWKEETGKRSGEIDVRKGIRLSARMIDALRVEHVQVHFDLKVVYPEDEGAVVKKGVSLFQVKKNVFATLVATVKNLTQEELRLLLRLQPSLHDQPHNQAMDLNKKFLWSGVLQQVLKGPLKPGEAKEAELGIVVLTSSTYEVNATVEEIRSRRWHLEGALDVGSNIERRIWHARRPCLIHAID